jgi:hypothetical protein
MQQYEFHAPTTDPLTHTPRPCKHNPSVRIICATSTDIGDQTSGATLEPGITQLTLNHDASTGRATYLQRWAPQTSNQIENFSHAYIEEIIILEGDLRDLKGRRSGTGEIVEGGGGKGEVWGIGAYAYRKPGMDHGPFRSEGGCLMFIVVIPVM